MKPGFFHYEYWAALSIIIVKPERLFEGYYFCSPIPRDAPNIKKVDFSTIHARNEYLKHRYVCDQSFSARNLLRGDCASVSLTHISLSFSSSSRMKGAYICLLNNCVSSPHHLVFTIFSSKSERISKKYIFPELEGYHWYFLPVDLPDVVMCEITGKGREREYFEIQTLFFIQEETLEETLARETKEKLWSGTPSVKAEFVKEGCRKSIPHDANLIIPSLSNVKCKDDSKSKESEWYDQSSEAQRMLTGKDSVRLSHLFIPFSSPSYLKGAYICVNRYSSPSFLFTFTDCDGKKTAKKYEFTRPEHEYEWHFLPIDLDNIVSCEIEGKGRWDEKNSRWFGICSLVFTMPEESEIIERLSLLPWK
ncbi:hypothetical protein ADUPG1_013759 [Aduncisulcus paluster]|uniref:Uncharacterized protein n=1 Tax=Aduncisulcus paluster TaxID=2918883 RepID=A0ABQ5K419_9EUKA|nr:hypothetical protein ADUPG1_013759 [Aduncisulcus paluster]